MPGAFAHLTLINHLRETPRLETAPGFPRQAIPWLLRHFKFAELGAVSPDYPYLAIRDASSLAWADNMHYLRTGEIIHAGIHILRQWQGMQMEKGMAWLLGYVSHVIMDVTIHPVVELKVGPYAANKRHHRQCEMHQDAYIFQRLNLGGIGLSEHLSSGIWACREPGTKMLDKDIHALWSGMLQRTYPQVYTDNPPAIHKWHQRFNRMVNKIAEEGNRLMPFARHLGVRAGLTYPNPNEVDQQYIKQLQTPGERMDYDVLFNHALHNTLQIWTVVANAVINQDDTYITVVRNWNLDTGKDEHGQFGFWA